MKLSPMYPVTGGNLTINCSIDVTLEIARSVVTFIFKGPAIKNDSNHVKNRTTQTQVITMNANNLRTITG